MGRQVLTLLLAGCLAGAWALRAAEPAGAMVFVAGTTAIDAQDAPWAYLVWHATDDALLAGRTVAVYRKSGNAASTNPYALVGTASLQTDPVALQLLIRRAAALGDDEATLGETLKNLFAELVVPFSLTTSEKLSAVICGAQGDPEQFGNLVFLARRHPAVAMGIGRAMAVRLPAGGWHTFELRDRGAGGVDGAVLGRVSLDAGAPVVLPAPFSLAEQVEQSPKGNMNVRLRWATPDALRRESLLNFGFAVHRMTAAYAVQHGYDQAAPPRTALGSPGIVRVNRLPVLIDEEDAGTNDFFFADDNRALAESGQAFTNGAAFYYFVTALDLLGRDGLCSTGILCRVCDRMPPGPPSRVKVTPFYTYAAGSGVPGLRVSWSPPRSVTNDPVTGYYVYRSHDYTQLLYHAGAPVAGPIPVTGTNRYSYLDTAFDANDVGRTMWYKVRAVDAGACGGNLSPNSIPAFGVIRDWTPPPAPTNVIVMIRCETPTVIITSVQDIPYGPGDDTNCAQRIVLTCPDGTSAGGTRWVDITTHHVDGYKEEYDTTTRHPLGGSATNIVVIPSGSNIVSLCIRASTRFGRASEPDCEEVPAPPEGHYKQINVRVTVNYNYVPAFGDCGLHVTRRPLSNGAVSSNIEPIVAIAPLPASFNPAEGGMEWRAYKSVNGGEQTLFAQGAVTNTPVVVVNIMGFVFNITNAVTFADDALAGTYGGIVRYYLQYLDEHGNPGPLILYNTIDCTPVQELPKPVITAIEPLGTETNCPRVRLTWFCPSEGVERFELSVGMHDPDAPPDIISASLSSNLYASGWSGLQVQNNEFFYGHFKYYRTGRLGAGFGTRTNPVYSVEIDAVPSAEYAVRLCARGRLGQGGDFSHARTFIWSPVPDGDVTTNTPPDGGLPLLPWPARRAPLVSPAFHDRLAAAFLDGDEYDGLEVDAVGVRIGEVTITNKVSGNWPYYTIFSVYPLTWLYRGSDTNTPSTIYPCVLYRYQVPTVKVPSVSGRVIQCSPLLDAIAYGLEGDNHDQLAIHDPFIRFVSRPQDPNHYEIYLLDTQPVIKGAAYQYLLVRFGAAGARLGEMEQTIPLNTVNIPP